MIMKILEEYIMKETGIVVFNPTKCSLIVPPVYIDLPPKTKEEIIIERRSNIKKTIKKILVITITLSSLITILTLGTIFIMKFVPNVYPIWLLVSFMLGCLASSIIFD